MPINEAELEERIYLRLLEHVDGWMKTVVKENVKPTLEALINQDDSVFDMSVDRSRHIPSSPAVDKHDTVKSVSKSFTDFNTKLVAIEDDLASMLKRQNELSDAIDVNKLNVDNYKCACINSNVSGTTQIELDSVRNEIALAHADIKTLRHFEKDLDWMKSEVFQQLNVHGNILTTAQQNYKECDDVVKNISNDMDTFTAKFREIDAWLDNLNQYGREDILEVHGLPPRSRASNKREEYEENTTALFIDFLYKTMNVTCNKYDISTSHRVMYNSPKSMNTEIKPIYVKFVNRDLKNHILYLKKQCRNRLQNADGSKIFLCENLTPYRRQLLKDAKEKLSTYKYIWTKNGKILVRKYNKSKVISLKDYAHLNHLINECKLPFKSVSSDILSKNNITTYKI